MNNTVLQLRNISKSYTQGENALRVLENVHLTLKAGMMAALIGPSGSGKSTLLHIAGLLDTPDAGEIALHGEALQTASDARRTRLRSTQIGFIYQFHHLLPELTALENVVLPQMIAGASRETARARAHELLTRLGLVERIAHLPSQLSGGEQQRVAIARALANKPALLLADEPTGNLDPATSDSVVDLLLQLAAEQNTAALIATHNMALAKRLHRVVTLKDGKILEMR